MKKVQLNIPTLGFIVATRAAIGVGLGLLLSSRVSDSQRRSVGMALVGIGAVATIPAVMAIVKGTRTRTALPVS